MTGMGRTQRIAALVALIFLFPVIMFAIAFFLTSFVFQRIGQQPSPLLAQIITSMLGLYLSFAILFILSRQFVNESGTFGPIFEAMGQIAKGDFTVRLNSAERDNLLVAKLTKTVNDMALDLNKLETMRQEFISNVSHEIQSPLTSIRGFARALQNDQLSSADRTHYLDVIETESTRLSRITENLLKLASLEAKQVKFEPKPYRLDKQIRSLILACEPQWTTKDIEMDVSLEEIETTADEDLLSQVWINLIANSLKFTPAGGRICIELHRNANEIEFKITDTGIGISEADQARIFERFYKADKSHTHSNNGGSGLGLSIAQKIVELHKGTISVESKPGVSTTFIVSLPTLRDEAHI
jgi:signal transduction histidine kinase